MRELVSWLIILFMLYSYAPNYYYRNMSKNIVKRFNSQKKEIALTFDDGPDKRYTPILLDILKQNNVKCTFFIVAEKALETPSLLKRIIEEGHSVGLHSLNHRSAWLSAPWQTKNDFKKSIKILEDLGYKTSYFRPPWGTFNLFTSYYASKHNLKVVLWSSDFKDWRKSVSKYKLKSKILKDIKNGDIIVLHDSNGAKGAPKKMISALDETIPKLKEKGYKFVTIDEKYGGVNVVKNI